MYGDFYFRPVGNEMKLMFEGFLSEIEIGTVHKTLMGMEIRDNFSRKATLSDTSWGLGASYQIVLSDGSKGKLSKRLDSENAYRLQGINAEEMKEKLKEKSGEGILGLLILFLLLSGLD